jgi:hypothetical protein
MGETNHIFNCRLFFQTTNFRLPLRSIQFPVHAGYRTIVIDKKWSLELIIVSILRARQSEVEV